MTTATEADARQLVGSGAAIASPTMFSEASERTILSCALNEERRPLLNRLLSLLSNDDFYLDQHKTLWSCIRTLSDNSLAHDAVAVLDYTASRQLFVGGVEYLMTLRDDTLAAVASDDAIDAAAKRVKEYATRRRMAAVFQQGLLLCASGRPATDIMGVVEDDMRNLRKLSESSNAGPQHIRFPLNKVMEDLDRAMDGGITAGIPCGYPELDELIYGLTDGDLIILAGRPGMGKTAAALNLARNIGTRAGPGDDRKVLAFSTEMRDVSLARRALALVSRINQGNLRSGQLTSEEVGRIGEGLGVLEQSGIYIDEEAGISLPELRARARAFVAEHGKCVIIVDYLQNLAAPEGTDTRSHVSIVSNGLKLLARELGVPVIALAQLSRGVEQRTNKRPLMSDLRESGTIEQDADVIIFLFRDEYYNPDCKEPGICEWIVAKQRDGAVGTVKLGFEKVYGLFYSIAQGG